MSRWGGISICVLLAAGIALVGRSSQLPQGVREQLNERLFEALVQGDVDRSSALLRAGADVHAELGHDLKAPDGSVVPAGRAPVRIAIDRKNLRLLRMLLDRGADPNQKDDMEWTPLEGYFEGRPTPGPEELALELLRRGANVNTHGGFLACGVGADPGTPLHDAASNNLLRVARALLARGADVNARSWAGRTPLHEASTPEMIGLLLAAGADLEARSESGRTPLADAVEGCWPEAVVALLRAGAKPVLGRDDSYLPSLIHHAISSCSWRGTPEEWKTLVKALIEHGADLDQPNEFKDTPLLYASSTPGQLEEDLALLLLAGGSDPKARDHAGDTALHSAVDREHPRLFRELLRKGVDVDARDDWGGTPLHQACFVFDQNPEYISALVAAGADVHAKDSEGREPLDHTDAQYRELVASLLGLW